MMKWLQDYIQWRYTWPYLLVLLVSVEASLLSPHSSQEVQQIANGAAKGAADNYLSWLESAQFWGAFATCVIAAFAFFQIRESRLSSERQLRAYVYFDGPKARKIPNPDRLNIYVTIVNGGVTWARNVVTHVGLGVRDDELDPFEGANWNELHAVPAVFGPSQTLDLHIADIPFTDFAAIRGGQSRVYVIGRVRYFDAFSDTTERRTEMSRRLIIGDDGGCSFSHMQTHNCADGDCG